MEMTKDNGSTCISCSCKSEYKISFVEEGLVNQELYICEEHRKELLDLLLPF